MYFYNFLKNCEDLNYVNYLENNMLKESLKVAVCIKININRIYEVFNINIKLQEHEFLNRSNG